MGTMETMGGQEQFRWGRWRRWENKNNLDGDDVNFGWECMRFGIQKILKQWDVEDVKNGCNYIDPKYLGRSNSYSSG